MENDRYEFSPFPTGDHNGPRWKIIRTPAKSPLWLRIISSVPVGVLTHHFGGRTSGHLTVNCEACKAGNQARWTGYLLATLLKDNQDVLFEFTESAGLDLKGIIEHYGFCRDLVIISQRPSGRTNGRVELTSKGKCESKLRLREEEHIAPLLHRIWRVKEPNLTKIVETTDTCLSEAERTFKAGREPKKRRNGFRREEMADVDLRQPGLFDLANFPVNGHDTAH